MEKEIHHHEEHEHTHEHHHEGKSSKLDLILYIISIIIFILAFLPTLETYKMVLYLTVIILAGYELILSGIKNIFKLNFEEETLMAIAVIAAFALGDFAESCMVVLLFRLGEFIEEKAVENSNKSIKNIVEIKAKTANLVENEETKIVDVETVKPGDIILIKPGEMVPLDCIVLEGKTTVDTANITGESKPQTIKENDNILSGVINLTGSLKCKVTKDLKNSTASQIVDLVYEATNNKGKTEKFITKFSKIYTPIVIVLAIILAIALPLILNQSIEIWIKRALVFLVASCPCSIVISVPLAFFSCIGRISKKGMLIKGTKHIEALSEAEYIALDKTGTITTGKMEIDKLIAEGKMPVKDMLVYMYNLEKNSNHPISTAIIKEVEKQDAKINKQVINYEEISGHGLYAKIEGKDVLFGNEKLLDKYDVAHTELMKNANYLVVDGEIQGYITLKEEIRKDIKELTNNAKKYGIKEIVMLTGDNEKSAEKISKEVGINKVYASLLPKQKLEKVKELKENGKVIFIGDGINDSPVLAEANFGIAMGEGTEIANSTADGILISNKISSILDIKSIAKKSMRIVKFNVAFSLIIKAVVLALGVIGIAPIWLAVAADTGVTLITVLNSIRILKYGKI